MSRKYKFHNKEGLYFSSDFIAFYFTQPVSDYIHQNPIRAGIVEKEEDYLYSSAKEYFTGRKGFVDLELLF